MAARSVSKSGAREEAREAAVHGRCGLRARLRGAGRRRDADDGRREGRPQDRRARARRAATKRCSPASEVRRRELETLEVTQAGVGRGLRAGDRADRAALGKAAMRVREFHRKRIPSSWEMREEGGGYMGSASARSRASVSTCPAARPSIRRSVIMNAVPASVVEVPEIVMVTPPRPDGTLRPEVLMAARVAGVHRVFKMGGAHAVAAFAYGTESVPRVDKIVGPGNVWVADREAASSSARSASTRSRDRPRWYRGRPQRPARLGRRRPDLAGRARRARAGRPDHAREGLVTRVQEQIARQLKTLARARWRARRSRTAARSS